ncbi:hypothetical protein KSE_02190 [Kitasatospora setae KM-6054]|uniref:Uncharacterized protein n=1 Tax=Kitasatospora setae (strain ATCC 33774 / DSM 43861 / JCM 3304 / KCC A-0304 / NBRC 14216 / KM-6054) TaxID=452652 RepID=E4N4D8_KITSK|nr:hypothetical protein KSE_02190 [Kitasatospora setae KM-6054]
MVAGGLALLLGGCLPGGADDGKDPAGQHPPRLPKSVEGAALRASSDNGSGGPTAWRGALGEAAAKGAQDLHLAAYGALDGTSGPEGFDGDGRAPKWFVQIAGADDPALRKYVTGDGLDRVSSSLPGTMGCRTEEAAAAGTAPTRTAFCVWAGERYVILVSGRDVPADLPARVIERIHAGTES